MITSTEPHLEHLHVDPDIDTRRALRFRALEFSRSVTHVPGVHVSRTYCFPDALVAWHSGPVGVDLERVAPCDARFAASICTPEELLDPPGDDAGVISLWSAKEALAKALGNALDYDPRRLPSPTRWVGGASGPWRARALSIVSDCRGWLVWSTAPRAIGS